MTVVYYRGPRALITSDVLEVWSPQHQVFRVSELTAVYVVRGADRRPTPLQVVPALAVAMAVSVPVAEASAGMFAVLLFLAAASLVTLACLRTQPRPYELRATHRGADVPLFECVNAQTFGQVKRALARAMERHADW
jgi:hypothetical protein